MLPHLGHAWIAFGTYFFEYHHASFVNVQVGIVYSCFVVIDVLKDHCSTGMRQQAWCRSRRLQYGAIGAEVSFQYGNARFRFDGIFKSTDQVSIIAFGFGNVFTQGFAIDSEGIGMEVLFDLFHDCW